MLKKEFRISRSKDYNNIYRYGKKIPGKYIIMYIMPSYQGINRFGIVTSKKVGNAVVRNRVKRRIRAILEQDLENIKGSHDIVIIGRRHINEAEFDALKRDILRGWKRAGLC